MQNMPTTFKAAGYQDDEEHIQKQKKKKMEGNLSVKYVEVDSQSTLCTKLKV
jgi:hypothetical protein